MHVLCSPTVNAHICGGFNNFYAWLLNGLIADALEANPLAKLECFVFAQRLPAGTFEGVQNEISLVEDTFPHHTGCFVRDLPNVSAFSGPESAQGQDVNFNERGLFWEPSHLPDGVPNAGNGDAVLQQMFGFWYPKCGQKSLEKMWRGLGLDPRFAAIARAKSRAAWHQTPGWTEVLRRALKLPGVLREPLQQACPGAKRRVYRSLGYAGQRACADVYVLPEGLTQAGIE